MQNNQRWCVFSSFILKVLALVFMTVDHVGVALGMFYGENYWVVMLLRMIGRLALPLFCFMIVEGVLHTKNIGKYFLRLGIMATIISIALYVGETFVDGISLRNQGNIFIDLLLGAITIYLLKQNNKYLKGLVALPIIYTILSFTATCLENTGSYLIHWMPYFLRTQYDIYAMLLFLLFYFAHIFKDMFLDYHARQTGIAKEYLLGTALERNVLNLLSLGAVIFATLIFYLIGYVLPNSYVYWNINLQNYAMIAGAFLLLYNGKRGYNAKWFQYGSYLYYPLHIIIIFGIIMLVS